MSWNAKVHWSEGLFLRPHHLQQADRYLENALESRTRYVTPYPYGFAAVETSRRAMEQTLSTNAVQRAFSRLVFRAIEKLPAAKRWMFRRMAGREG